MIKKYKNISVVFLLVMLIFSCQEEEMRFVDPMIGGLCDQAEESVEDLMDGGTWTNSLIGFREQRMKLLGILELIEQDKYKGDNYTLENKEASAQKVEATIADVEFYIDSVWNASVGSAFSDVDPNSAGIVNFASQKYVETGNSVDEAYNWLMAESEDEAGTEWSSNDLAVLQEDIGVLKDLAALDDEEVNQFVNDLKAQFAEMQQQYAALETEVSSSPYFTQAQKTLYASLEQPLADMAVTIEENLSLDTKDQLDAINRDLYALVYFVENNYTSPAQKPEVYGEISSITELRWFSEEATIEDYNNEWVLTTDIDAAETHRWNPDADEKGFQTIKPTVACHFDGQFHFISGLYMTKIGGAANGERSGFFSDIRGGSIKNLGLVNVEYDKADGAGPGNQGGVLAGWLTSTTVSKCFTHGESINLSQSGGFLGRPQHAVTIVDCFSAVDMVSVGIDNNTTSFIGLPVLDLSIENCYNTGYSQQRAIFGHGVAVSLTAAHIYYDSETVGTTVLDRGDALYGDTPVKLSDDGVVTDLPTGQWNDLGNFSGFSSDVWEIRTVPQIDPNPRPYLKGFDYDVLEGFLTPPDDV